MIKTKLDLRGLDNLARRLKTLAATKVKVGFFEDDEYGDGTPVAQVAQWNEYGTRFHPERPFMQETLHDKQTRAKLIKALAKAATAAVTGKGSARAILATVGKLLTEEIKVTIANYPGSNSPSTIERKGFDRPLFETGKMLESVKFKFAA